MLQRLFGNEAIEKVIFYLLKNDSCYGKELAQNFDISLGYVQRTLYKLERANVIVSFQVGRTRVFNLNPRYALINELTLFFEKAYSFLPDDIKSRYYEKTDRKRPRRTGKKL